jgi:chromosome partitioning protein
MSGRVIGKIISFIIQKGGCGKTTTTVNVGGYLAKSGFKVLMIDMDPQGNMTQHFGLVPENLDITIRNVLKNEVDITEAIQKRSENIEIIGNNILTSGDEITFLNSYSREFLLKDKLLRLIHSYDYILIDCPPSLGILSLNSLVASQEMVIVVAPDFFPLMAIKPLYETYQIIQKKLNKSLRIKGIIINMFDPRTKHARQVLDVLEKNFPDKIYHSFIRQSVSLKDASGEGKTIFEFDEQSMGAVDFKALGDEFVLDNLSVQKRYHHFETVFNKLSSNEQKMIEEKASAELNPYTRDLLQRKSDSVTANQAFKISRNQILEKLYPIGESHER